MDRRNSNARIKANNKYNAKTYDQLRCNYRKTERLNELVEYAAQQRNTSKAEYILNAVRDRLTKDGITLDMLPPIEDKEPT